MEPNGFTGTVISGSGDTYTMDLEAPDGSTITGATVTILQIDAGEDIDDGTKMLVVKIGTDYFAQPPIWLP